MTWLTENWINLINVATAIVTAASIIVKITPNTKDDELLGKIKALLDVIAINTKK